MTYMFSLVPTFNLPQSCVHHQGTQLHHFFSQMICLSFKPVSWRVWLRMLKDPQQNLVAIWIEMFIQLSIGGLKSVIKVNCGWIFKM